MRKIMNSISMLIPALLLFIVRRIVHSIIILICIRMSMTFMGLNSGFPTIFLDINPTKSNATFAISHTIATLPGIVSPIINGIIILNFGGNTKQLLWTIICFTAAIIIAIGDTFF